MRPALGQTLRVPGPARMGRLEVGMGRIGVDMADPRVSPAERADDALRLNRKRPAGRSTHECFLRAGGEAGASCSMRSRGQRR